MRTHTAQRSSGSALAAVGAALVLCACSPAHRSAARLRPGPASATTSSALGASSAAAVPDLARTAWRTTVDGAVYAQPLVVGSRVFVATERDIVYALSLATGQVLWHTSVGAPLTDVAAHAGCGDIDPLGITSTPVADPATGTLYVVGEVSDGARSPTVHRELVGLAMDTGSITRQADANPTGGGDRQVDLLQRAGLVLDGGRVDVGFGGQYGDCGYYHGWVVGVSTTPGVANQQFDTTPGGSGGAVWQGGAPPSVDSAGNLYVVTGNQGSQGAAGDYERVVKLSPTLVPEASFRDRAATGDEDFGTGEPLLLPGGTLFAVGKTDIGYVLRQSDLSLVARIPGVCGSDPDGRLAYDAATDAVYVPCRGGGIQQVRLGTGTLGWRAGTVNSSPVLAAGSLWALSYPGGTLQALNPATGAVEQTASIGRTPPFATPAYAGGMLVAADASGTVEAFGS
jgi:polyvinyl alcohol dehydrogenase (cytochrome)